MNTNSFPLVSIITVNYRQEAITMDLMHSLAKITYPNFEVIVVDNASEKCIEFQLLEILPRTTYIQSPKNLGFAGGNNLGIKVAKGEYMLFLNNDTEVEKNFLEPLVELLVSNPKIGLVSPRLIYHNSGNTIQYAGASRIHPLTGRGHKIGWMEKDQGQYNEIRKTQLGHGAAMLIPTKVIEEVGLMPEEFFLYYEEHDWTEQIKRAGYEVYYNGLSKIYHKESVSVGRYSDLKVYYLTRNRILFIKRNSKGITRWLSLAFFYGIATPKNLLKHSIRREWSFFKAFLGGLGFDAYKLEIH